MADELAALILAAGAGTRLRPLTSLRPKALCPVNNVPLVDLAIDVVRPYTDDIAVNVHHHRAMLIEHLAGRVGVSIEEPRPLGSAGAVGKLRGWLDGRDLLIVNADRYHIDDLHTLVDGWDRERARLLVVDDPQHADFDAVARFAGASLLPAALTSRLVAEPSSLFERIWQPEREAGRLELVTSTEEFVDCGTPGEYLRANLIASGGKSVVSPAAIVEGQVERSVVWPFAYVGPDEYLCDAIRAPGGITVAASGARTT